MVTLSKQTTKGIEYWVMRWRTPDGRRPGESLGPTSAMSKRQAEVQRRRKEAELTTNPGYAAAGRAPALKSYTDEYIKSRQKELRPGTLLLHEKTIAYLIKQFGDFRRIDTITRADARAFKTAMTSGDLKSASKRPRDLEAATIDGHMRNARVIFQQAVEDDRLLYNPFDRLKSAGQDDKDWHYVDAAEFAKLMHAANESWRRMLALGRMAGLRRDEALHVKWEHVDWETHQLTIISSEDWSVKDAESRTVPICPELNALLLDAFDSAPAGATFIVEPGTIAVKNIWRDAGALCRRADVKVYAKPMHALRKSCITDWAAQHPAHVIKEWAGHSDIRTTLKYYLKVSPRDYEAGANAAILPGWTKLWTKNEPAEPVATGPAPSTTAD